MSVILKKGLILSRTVSTLMLVFMMHLTWLPAYAAVEPPVNSHVQTYANNSVWDIDPAGTHTKGSSFWQKLDWLFFGSVKGSGWQFFSCATILVSSCHQAGNGGWHVIGQKISTSQGKTHDLSSMAVMGPTGHLAVHCSIMDGSVLTSGVAQCEKLGGKVAEIIRQALKK